MKNECAISIDEIGRSLSALSTTVRGLSVISDRLRQIMGAEIPVDRFDGLPLSMIPDLRCDDKVFLRQMSKAVARKTSLDRMAAYESIVKLLVADLVRVMEKIELIDERIRLQSEDSAERRVIINRKGALNTTAKILVVRIKMCAERWCEARRRVANIVAGMTEKMYASLGDVSCGASIRKNAVSGIFSSIVKMDDIKAKKGE